MLNIEELFEQKENCLSVEDAIKIFQYYRPFDKLDETYFSNEIFQHKLMFALDNIDDKSDINEIIKIISKNLIDTQYSVEQDIFVLYDELKKRDLSIRLKDSYGISLGGG